MGLIQQVFKHLDGAGETGNWLREQKTLDLPNVTFYAEQPRAQVSLLLDIL